MKLLSKRVVMKTATNKKKHCFDIIFEWEDILAEELKCEVLLRKESEFKFDEKCRKLYKKVPVPFYRLFHFFDKKRGYNVVMFDASTKRQDGIYNHKRYIPCLIDYFLSEDLYETFLKAYNKNPLVLVSSREVYEYLKRKECPIKLAHFPLSLPDNYKTNEIYKKEYDLIIAGRQNPLLMTYVEKYEKKYPDAKIIRRKYEDDHFLYYLSSTGETISVGDTREAYIDLLRKSRIALYTTPGMDGTRPDANGWNQVTPRFLEEVSSQCHIIARYPDNADTRWYDMGRICKCVESYEEFEMMMNDYRQKTVDIVLYREYLEAHYTSKRAELLKHILENNGMGNRA